MSSHRPARCCAALCAGALALALLSGCGGADDAQRAAGRSRMKEYLAAHGGGEITDCRVDTLRPDASTLMPSDYVEGTFRAGGETYAFAVNTVTGAVFTSERAEEFRRRCVGAAETALGLPPGSCVGCCAVAERYAPAWQEEKPEWPWATAFLGDVLPVDAQDLDALAAAALTDGSERVIIYIVCRGVPLAPDRWSEADVADWDGAEVSVMALPAPDAPLPAPEELTVDYRNDFPGDLVILSDGGIRFRPGT